MRRIRLWADFGHDPLFEESVPEAPADAPDGGAAVIEGPAALALLADSPVLSDALRTDLRAVAERRPDAPAVAYVIERFRIEVGQGDSRGDEIPFVVLGGFADGEEQDEGERAPLTATLPLSEQLRRDLLAWAAREPGLRDWPSAADCMVFVDDGWALLARLQSELGPGYRVDYDLLTGTRRSG